MWFVSRRKHEDLQARYQNLADNHEQVKEELTASRRATIRLAGNYTHLMETGEPMPMFSRPSKVQQRITSLERRLRFARKAGVRILAAYAAEKERADLLEKVSSLSEEARLRRRVAHLERQLDDATKGGDQGTPIRKSWGLK